MQGGRRPRESYVGGGRRIGLREPEGGGAEPESHGGGAEPESHGGGAEPENHGGGV